jgi:hypothetical protein
MEGRYENCGEKNVKHFGISAQNRFGRPEHEGSLQRTASQYSVLFVVIRWTFLPFAFPFLLSSLISF